MGDYEVWECLHKYHVKGKFNLRKDKRKYIAGYMILKVKYFLA